ncbi:hypothetical protein TNCV_4726311 [Trichonephila clavipes]|nr:hypothetical protein TNCV_4726311 [Trichonephila clavipes]
MRLSDRDSDDIINSRSFTRVLLNIYPTYEITCGLALSCFNTGAGCTLQQGQTSVLLFAVNVSHRRRRIKYYATSNIDFLCRAGLNLGEMNWFVAFSRLPPHSSLTVIHPQTETRFISEQYPMPFNGPDTTTMTPR